MEHRVSAPNCLPIIHIHHTHNEADIYSLRLPLFIILTITNIKQEKEQNAFKHPVPFFITQYSNPTSIYDPAAAQVHVVVVAFVLVVAEASAFVAVVAASVAVVAEVFVVVAVAWVAVVAGVFVVVEAAALAAVAVAVFVEIEACRLALPGAWPCNRYSFVEPE